MNFYRNLNVREMDFTSVVNRLCLFFLFFSMLFYNFIFIYNKEISNELSKKDFFLDLFKMNYLKLFNYYYNNNLPLEEIEISKRKIILSKETESFYCLVQKYKDLKEKLLYEVEVYKNPKMKEKKKTIRKK